MKTVVETELLSCCTIICGRGVNQVNRNALAGSEFVGILSMDLLDLFFMTNRTVRTPKRMRKRTPKVLERLVYNRNGLISMHANYYYEDDRTVV